MFTAQGPSVFHIIEVAVVQFAQLVYNTYISNSVFSSCKETHVLDHHHRASEFSCKRAMRAVLDLPWSLPWAISIVYCPLYM